MIKLIATDIDGTLVKDGTMQISPEYMTVIDKLTAKGIRFVACSGRQFISEKRLFAPISDKLLYVSDGGTVVRSPHEILKVHTMPEEVWKGMCQMVQDKMPHCDCFIATPDYCLAEDAGSPDVPLAARFLRIRYPGGERLLDIKIRILQVLPSTTEMPVKRCRSAFTPSWHDKAKLAAAGKEWMDCNPLGVTKGTAIEFLQEHFGISPEETLTFGDNLNDIEMLKNAGQSYAVSNARDEVRAAAGDVCPPYWEDGVLQILKRFL